MIALSIYNIATGFDANSFPGPHPNTARLADDFTQLT